MSPLLKSLDTVLVRRYGSQKVRCGDVVTFRRQGGEGNITHRVVSVGPEGIRTRGDNAVDVDRWVLTSDEILGRVVRVHRRKKQMHVRGGLAGRLFAVAVRPIPLIRSGMFTLLRPVYFRLARARLLRRWLPRMKTRVLAFNGPEGMELQLLMGRCVIGRRSAGTGLWRLRRPFDLFLDEASLPARDPRHPFSS